MGQGNYSECEPDKTQLVAFHLFNLGILVWIGCIFFFGVGVAGTIFKILPSKDLAGQLNQAILQKLHLIEFFCAFLILISFFIEKNFFRIKKNYFLIILFLIMCGVLLFYGIYLENEMKELRSLIVSLDKPVKENFSSIKEFRHLHHIYSRLVSLNLILGLLLYFLRTKNFFRIFSREKTLPLAQ